MSMAAGEYVSVRVESGIRAYYQFVETGGARWANMHAALPQWLSMTMG
jgi:hypothetical protein